MSKAYILEYIRDKYTLYDLIEKLEPYMSIDDLVDALQHIIDNNFTQAFEEELEAYYID